MASADIVGGSEEVHRFFRLWTHFSGRSLRIKDGGADLLSVLNNSFSLSFTLLYLCEAFPGRGWTFPEPGVEGPESLLEPAK